MATDLKKSQTLLLVQAAVQACEDKKGQDIRILELDPVDSGLTDFFLIVSASNERQSIAIADEIELRLKRQFGMYSNSVEGRRRGEWILLDYVDFVVHVFLAERRAFYDIERLRKSARPFTPAEFDAELKAALSAKTRATRDKAVAAKKAPAKKAVAQKTVAKKAVVKKAVAKKAAPKKTTAKKTAVKKTAVKKAATTKTVKKAVKKVVAKKAVVKKAIVKKIAKKATPKTATKKTAMKKTVKTAAKKAVKKAAKKTSRKK